MKTIEAISKIVKYLFSGSNILLAKLATRKAKPNGQFYLEQHKAEDFIKDKPIRELPGRILLIKSLQSYMAVQFKVIV